VPPAPPTEPQAWSAPTGKPLEDSQPGLTSGGSARHPSRRNEPAVEGPFQARSTLVSASEHGQADEVTPLSSHLASHLSSHLDASGAARMVDISEKTTTLRRAVASGSVRMLPETAMRIMRADAPKGEVIGAARIAGIMAAKRTPELIPLCHGIALTHVGIDIQVRVEGDIAEARVTATTEALDRTGVEMEAMVAVSVACLTIYDMLKGIDRAMTITEIQLLEKSGGRSGHFRRGDAQA
jgi:cyclic pyranopterin phosphate synthase